MFDRKVIPIGLLILINNYFCRSVVSKYKKALVSFQNYKKKLDKNLNGF
jgi:hypothetical protein